MGKQKLLIMETEGGTLRSPGSGWSTEDGDLIDPTKEIGLSGGGRCPAYATPMHAIAEGWRLMAPPRSYQVEEETLHEWWFER